MSRFWNFNLRACHTRSIGFVSQLAARFGRAEAIRVLVEKGGADIQQERSGVTGWVALHEAAFRGHADCVKV